MECVEADHDFLVSDPLRRLADALGRWGFRSNEDAGSPSLGSPA
jgi:hypothetical protein